MTVNEATKLYERIIGQLVHSNLREAFVNLSYLIQQNGFGLAYDQLSELESNYRFLLKFRLEGVPDPNQEKVYADLRRRALDLTDEAWHLWMSMRSPQLYYDKVRAARIEEEVTAETLLAVIKQTGEDLALAEVIEREDLRREKILALNKQRERLVQRALEARRVKRDRQRGNEGGGQQQQGAAVGSPIKRHGGLPLDRDRDRRRWRRNRPAAAAGWGNRRDGAGQRRTRESP